jgi:hypothetical protein
MALIVATGYAANRLHLAPSASLQTIPTTTFPGEAAPPSVPAQAARFEGQES